MNRILVAVLVLCVGWIRAARAQTKASDKEWEAIVEAAKKEGKVVVAGSPDPVMRNDDHSKIHRALRHSHRVHRRPLEPDRRRGSRPNGHRASSASTFISPGPTPRPTSFTAIR